MVIFSLIPRSIQMVRIIFLLENINLVVLWKSGFNPCVPDCSCDRINSSCVSLRGNLRSLVAKIHWGPLRGLWLLLLLSLTSCRVNPLSRGLCWQCLESNCPASPCQVQGNLLGTQVELIHLLWKCLLLLLQVPLLVDRYPWSWILANDWGARIF